MCDNKSKAKVFPTYDQVFSERDETNLIRLVNDITSKKYTLEELAEKVGFATSFKRPHKGSHRFRMPSEVEFINLGLGENRIHYNYTFILGVNRTNGDPVTGEIDQYWMHTEIPVNKSNLPTAFAEFYYYPGFGIYVQTIQATIIQKQYRKTVLDELKGVLNDEGDKRFQNLIEYGIPWGNSVRTNLFGALSIWFAEHLGVDKVYFRKQIIHAGYEQARRYATKFVQPRGVEIMVIDDIPSVARRFVYEKFATYLSSPQPL